MSDVPKALDGTYYILNRKTLKELLIYLPDIWSATSQVRVWVSDPPGERIWRKWDVSYNTAKKAYEISTTNSVANARRWMKDDGNGAIVNADQTYCRLIPVKGHSNYYFIAPNLDAQIVVLRDPNPVGVEGDDKTLSLTPLNEDDQTAMWEFVPVTDS